MVVVEGSECRFVIVIELLYSDNLCAYTWCRDPFGEYDDCDGVKYMVQLNIYKYLLEKYYGISVSSTQLVSFHPRQDTYLTVEVPCMQAEVAAMFAGLKTL
jgi:hypothetical protein